MQIGQRLKFARQAVGYTIQKASREARIGESSISEFENSKREPKFSQLAKLAEVYKKPVEFFLGEEPIVQNMMLWRQKPSMGGAKEKTEAEFNQLCEQYHKLEVLTDELRRVSLPQSAVKNANEFSYQEACSLAEKALKEFQLGDRPSSSLKQILEESFYVKIFHLDFSGSAISTNSEIFGSAILLNGKSKAWRRNYDLAHELFHLLTWHIFRTAASQENEPSEIEEKLANAFASRLLLPTDSVKERIEAYADDDGKVSYEALDEVAREFGVSLGALFWRMVSLYNKSPEEVEQHLAKAKTAAFRRPPRQSDTSDTLPERYCSLAIKALREGRLSLMQFAKYVRITYKKAQEYLAEDEDFTDEKASISLA
ncbi:MAG: ImmA/IrrE family metallo-endopeptidase [Phycisphaerae bacterium]|nr:ImmA/IrrE family metallo-endopeptidase [Phycisphaerae bacterium]